MSGTIGQRVYKLFVLDQNKKPLGFLKSFFRAVYRSLSLTVLFPFLSLIWNSKKQTQFDKIIDTQVYSAAEKKPISSSHRLILKDVFQGAGLGFLLNIFLFLSVGTFYLQKRSFDFDSKSNLQSQACPAVSKLKSEIQKQTGKIHNRVNTTLALWFSGFESVDCLVKEIDFAQRANQKDTRAQLALGLMLVSKQPEISQKILNHICSSEPSSVECNWAESYVNWPFSTFEKDESSILDELFEVRRNFDLGFYKKSEEILNQIPKSSQLKNFYFIEKYKNHIAQNKTENEIIDVIEYSLKDPIKVTELKLWRCSEKALSYCSQELRDACSPLLKELEDLNVLDLDSKFMKSNTEACVKGLSENSEFPKSLFQNKRSLASKSHQKNKVMAQNSGLPRRMRDLALKKVIEYSDSEEEIQALKSEWIRVTDRDRSWRFIGELLSSKYSTQKWEQGSPSVLEYLKQHYQGENFVSLGFLNQ